MRIQQLSEVLEFIAKSRLDMGQLYGRLHRNADSTRVKMMLEYLQQHQQHVHDSIENYIDEAPKRMLETWYKDITFEDFEKRCQDSTLAANMSEDDVLEMHLDLENRLIGFLEKTANSTEVTEIKDALLDLVRVEKTQQKRMVHSALRMEDI
ncbi:MULTISPECIES: hypothetical protein [unclassified Shewanella]|uniref:hypothetical protein n=1 Tax=unclassified Shewanella TaxID=196818 RepID=UPI000C82924D|nr:MULTISPECIES: hypothetical protein [unclassified Shewanella]MDO6618069.1 hypothetical protein [Shewanella sp. 6_MG-2023]MDO6640946.1 hypothetical protein [Shewanella sp. 5_MG-2023]MDO6679228.1 hypothetical protein [Shewanella sp. 4_MG-2023]MDO6776529.1 hypothetical protein [Shewanella sp. 3_MG-2023]PMG30684.1 hypothetical protein BCU94_01960 [Shewanella sp. 10N.286.52.C2]